MKSGRTLVNLAQELQRQLQTKKDLVVPSQLVRHSTGDSGGTHLVIEENGGPVRYGVTPLARRQLVGRLEQADRRAVDPRRQHLLGIGGR